MGQTDRHTLDKNKTGQTLVRAAKKCWSFLHESFKSGHIHSLLSVAIHTFADSELRSLQNLASADRMGSDGCTQEIVRSSCLSALLSPLKL